ncbi:MAG: VanW family protein [Clostridia bacterium]|nr:VanW family protein [Clostridia bacterium]
MNQILYNASYSARKNRIMIAILVLLIVAVICLSTIFAINNKSNENIIKNVFASGIDISLKSQEDAKEMLESKIKEYGNIKLVLNLGGQDYNIVANDMGFHATNINEAVTEAYNYGRAGNLVENNYEILFSNFKNKDINLEFDVEDELYGLLIKKLSEASDAVVADDTYEVNENVVTITKGQDGKKIDQTVLREYIITAVVNQVPRIEVPVSESTANSINFEELYNEICTAPKNAELIKGDKFEIKVEEKGFAFDVSEAKKLYRETEAGGSFEITMTEVEPEITVADLDVDLYTNVLATFTTTYDTTEKNRVQNLQTASSRCNDTVINPGEEFSFHKTVGTRTIANGYASAHSYAGGNVVNTVGGGICQISSTLYNIVLKTNNLEIVERKAHGMPVAYAEPGLDATIAEGYIDFRFKNNRDYPIKISSKVENGKVVMSILGLAEENEPVIELKSVKLTTIAAKTITKNDSTMYQGTSKVVQDPVDGCTSEAYRIIKDKEGNVISETLLSKDKYIATDKIVKVGTKVKQPVVQPPVVDPEPEPEPEPPRDIPPGWGSPESPYGG